VDYEEVYWLQIGEGESQYTTKVSKEAFMAMERECGFHGEPGKLATHGFVAPGDSKQGTLLVRGWIRTEELVMPPEVPGA